MKMNNLSSRGNKLASNPARIDIELFFDAVQNLYCPENNPDGAFPLNVAENHLMAETIREKLNEITTADPIPDWVLSYTDTTGHPSVRETISGFMENHLCRCPIPPGTIGFSSGAAAVIETSSFVLADRGDVVVIPAPGYPVYSGDMGIKSGLERFDLQTHYNIWETGSAAPVTADLLEAAKREIEMRGKRFRMLVITSPDNPTGCMYGPEKFGELAAWCIKNEVHMIVNEIYAFSRIDTSDDLISGDYGEEVVFSSFANTMNELQSNYLHLWYGLSKDFAMSGLRFGIVHSLNEDFIKAIRNVNIPHMVSNHTQWMIGELLGDDEFIEKYIRENRDQVTSSYKVVVTTLKKLHIPYVPARGSLFVWADFSKYLKEDSDKGQADLWTKIYKDTGVLLTPGAGFGHRKKGLFRIVHTAVPTIHLTTAMKKLENYLSSG